jgi:hypothetical protein
MTKAPKLSKRSTTLLDAFDESAQDRALQREWGSGPSVDTSEKHYVNDKAALYKHVARLEARIKRLKEQQQ